MCFFSQLSKPVKEIEKRFKAVFQHPEIFKAGTYNGFNYPETPVITDNKSEIIQLFHWGLIPEWAKNNEIRKYTLNARMETIHEKPSFKNSVHKRCLIIADGFFEWQWLDAKGKQKQKYELIMPESSLFAFAGLWSEWTDPHTGERLKTYCILTTEANELLCKIHNSKKRMPVIVAEDYEMQWLQGGELKMDNERLLALEAK
jgi:putative SOS response-associated peptidase YedK